MALQAALGGLGCLQGPRGSFELFRCLWGKALVCLSLGSLGHIVGQNRAISVFPGGLRGPSAAPRIP
eukprot:9116151-Pyramimonas_sp.AAC.1